MNISINDMSLRNNLKTFINFVFFFYEISTIIITGGVYDKLVTYFLQDFLPSTFVIIFILGFFSYYVYYKNS